MKKETEQLQKELKGCIDLSRFLRENEKEMISRDLGMLIDETRAQKGLSKAELARRSGISEFYLYQILSGKRQPSRDAILGLCLGLGCSVEQAERMLRIGGYSDLYVRIRRDVIIRFALQKGWSLPQLNDTLLEQGEMTIGGPVRPESGKTETNQGNEESQLT